MGCRSKLWKTGKNKKPGQYQPSKEDFKAGFKEKIRFFTTFFKKTSDNKLFDPSTLNCNSIVNEFTVCVKSVFIFGWAEDQMYPPIKSNGISKI